MPYYTLGCGVSLDYLMHIQSTLLPGRSYIFAVIYASLQAITAMFPSNSHITVVSIVIGLGPEHGGASRP
jgi:hypothetical protein